MTSANKTNMTSANKTNKRRVKLICKKEDYYAYDHEYYNYILFAGEPDLSDPRDVSYKNSLRIDNREIKFRKDAMKFYRADLSRFYFIFDNA